jgi:predicted nucleic acid-binding protein
MSAGPLLIDTCGWIDFLRARDGRLGDRVEEALRDDSARMCGVNVAELLHGAKGKKERQQLELLFANVPCLSVADEDWVMAGSLLQALKADGCNLPLSDALIAAIARRHELPVLTDDAHFGRLGVKLA